MTPRIEPYPAAEWDPETRKILEGWPLEGKSGNAFNVFTTMARHPVLMRSWLVFADHILTHSTLPPREREMVILRVGWLCRSDYEWGHHVVIARNVGASEDDIRHVATGPDAAGLSEFDAALLRGVDELIADARLSDATWNALAKQYNVKQMMDLVFTVGQYRLVSMALNSFGVELEEGYEGLPGKSR